MDALLRVVSDMILSGAGRQAPEGISFGIILVGREELISELEVYPIDGGGAFTLPDIEEIDFYCDDSPFGAM